MMRMLFGLFGRGPRARHLNYIGMTRAQAAAAFQEYQNERGPALERLRERLSAEGQDPDVLLDGSIESLVPLWRWILAHLTGPDAAGATAPAAVPREAWPSWVRYTFEEERVQSLESMFLLDGLVSYLAVVVQNRAPLAQWTVARHPVKRYAGNNHPVLVSGKGDDHNFLPGVILNHARASLKGMRESPEDAIATYARNVIEHLNRGENPSEEEVQEEEPLVEVEDLGVDELRGRELEVGLREDIAHEHSRTVDRMAKALGKENGITRVIREDREVLLVATATWTTARLQGWVCDYLDEKISDRKPA